MLLQTQIQNSIPRTEFHPLQKRLLMVLGRKVEEKVTTLLILLTAVYL